MYRVSIHCARDSHDAIWCTASKNQFPNQGMSFVHGIRPTTDKEIVLPAACSLERHSQSGLAYLFCHCWWLLRISSHCGQNGTSLKKTSLPMTSELEGVFFTPVKGIIHPLSVPLASMSLKLFYQMENQESKIPNSMLHQRAPQKSKECVYLVQVEDKREGSVFWKTHLRQRNDGRRCTTASSEGTPVVADKQESSPTCSAKGK